MESAVDPPENAVVGPRHYVFLDPDGTGGDRWLYVIVEAGTRVFYQQQYGGTACREGQTEGFLVPLSGSDELDALRGLFKKGVRGPGCAGSDGERDRLRRVVAALRYWACDGSTEEPHSLILDESRIAEADEAWIPVITPDGPGMLVWKNSD